MEQVKAVLGTSSDDLRSVSLNDDFYSSTFDRVNSPYKDRVELYDTFQWGLDVLPGSNGKGEGS